MLMHKDSLTDFTGFFLGVAGIALLLASIDEFAFHFIKSQLRVFAFGQSPPEVLYFIFRSSGLVQTALALWVWVLITVYLATRLW